MNVKLDLIDKRREYSEITDSGTLGTGEYNTLTENKKNRNSISNLFQCDSYIRNFNIIFIYAKK